MERSRDSMQMFIRGGKLHVLAFGDREMLCRSCVDCGRHTGSYCDFCIAKERSPKEEWADGQHTPLCTECGRKFDMCHYCRGQKWATPPPT